MNARLLLFAAGSLAALSWAPLVRSEEVLVPRGAKSSWQFLDAGQPAGKGWATPEFDATKWKSGPAPLGYGEPDMGRTVSYGANARTKPITTFFRRAVNVEDPAKVATLVIEIRRDDGAVVYWNGREIARSNMPAGSIMAYRHICHS